MSEFFITARSFAAPFVSDTSEGYVEAVTAREALEEYAATYSHPAGLYAAEAWSSADAYHKGDGPEAQWLCAHEQAKCQATEGKGGFSYFGHEPGRFEVNGEEVVVSGDPKAGSVVGPSPRSR